MPADRPSSTGLSGDCATGNKSCPLGNVHDPVRSPETAATIHETQIVGSGSQLNRQTWRVRGVPLGFSKERLAGLLQHHPSLQRPSGDTLDDVDDDSGGTGSSNGAWVYTLAPDLRRNQVATVRFDHLPTCLRTLKRGKQLSINISTDLESTNTDSKQVHPTTKLAIDQHFKGITVLFSPPSGEHTVDVLAVPGLGSHPFGSFVNKEDGHMWLNDSLPQDIPTARVLIYGYESRLEDSTSFAKLDDLAGSLRLNILSLLRSRKQKTLILIGHSLGGLLIKEALTQMTKSDSEANLMKDIFGGLFFGVPNGGMDIESLIPIVGDQPNRALLDSLGTINSQILRLQNGNFASFLKQTAFELFCFYETRLSPTAIQDSAGQWKMNGSLRCLVSRDSATSCLPTGVSPDHAAELDRTHSELVKFAAHDSDYDKVRYVLNQMYQGCLKASETSRFPQQKMQLPLRSISQVGLDDTPQTTPGENSSSAEGNSYWSSSNIPSPDPRGTTPNTPTLEDRVLSLLEKGHKSWKQNNPNSEECLGIYLEAFDLIRQHKDNSSMNSSTRFRVYLRLGTCEMRKALANRRKHVEFLKRAESRFSLAEEDLNGFEGGEGEGEHRKYMIELSLEKGKLEAARDHLSSKNGKIKKNTVKRLIRDMEDQIKKLDVLSGLGWEVKEIQTEAEMATRWINGLSSSWRHSFHIT